MEREQILNNGSIEQRSLCLALIRQTMSGVEDGCSAFHMREMNLNWGLYERVTDYNRNRIHSESAVFLYLEKQRDCKELFH